MIMNTEPTPEMIAYAEQQTKELREQLANNERAYNEGALIACHQQKRIADLSEQLTLWREDAERLTKDVEKQIAILDEEIDMGGSERQWRIASYLKNALAAHAALVNETTP